MQISSDQNLTRRQPMNYANNLFETAALKIAPSDKPFWYTSGLIGPYFINTHFLCGGERTAIEILASIDEKSSDKKTFPDFILAYLEKVYKEYPIYKAVIDGLVEKIKPIIEQEQIKFVSGGERRDWFFAPIVAKLLKLPCLYIYNDCKVFSEQGDEIKDLQNANVVNIADLLTVGSSYTTKWIPALKKINGNLVASANAVDRCQGGSEILSAHGIKSVVSLISIGEDLFKDALVQGYIDQNQMNIVLAYLADEHNSMKEFLVANRNFLEEALSSSDEKTKKRAMLMRDTDPYGMS